MQRPVVGTQGPRTANTCQGNYMRIVRPTMPTGCDLLLFRLHCSIRDLIGSTSLEQGPQIPPRGYPIEQFFR
jgi:hypothetical protein